MDELALSLTTQNIIASTEILNAENKITYNYMFFIFQSYRLTHAWIVGH